MDDVYDRLPKAPLWHNGHFYWRQSLAELGVRYSEPGPDHPRSHLAAALRWTGYDIDILRESWPDPAGPPDDLFGIGLPLDPDFDASAFLADAHIRYFRAWSNADATRLTDPAQTDLISGHFHGFGWGLAERGAEGWARAIGPDGRAMLLLRLPRGRGAQIRLYGTHSPRDRQRMLGIYVNGCATGMICEDARGGQPVLRFDIGHEMAEPGQVRILLCVQTTLAGAASLAFTGIDIRIR
jgi:hypothetical protein